MQLSPVCQPLLMRTVLAQPFYLHPWNRRASSSAALNPAHSDTPHLGYLDRGEGGVGSLVAQSPAADAALPAE